MSNKFITILYNNIYSTPLVVNIPYSKKWIEKLKSVNGGYINDEKISVEQEQIIYEIEQRITILNDYEKEDILDTFGDSLVIPPNEVGSWAKYIIKDGLEIPFNSEGLFIVGYMGF